MRRPRGCPIPPAAPKTATFRFGELELDMHLVVCVLVAADTDLFNNVATDRAAIFLSTGRKESTPKSKSLDQGIPHRKDDDNKKRNKGKRRVTRAH
jgi:hypothetical protein